MWSYYGSKSKIINHYPPPKFDKIIEPFAGSARYALKYFDRDILLMDKDSVIVDIWNYLQVASVSDVRNLQRLKKGDDLRNVKSISNVERDFLGFLYSAAQSWPANIVSKFGEVHMCGNGRRDKLNKIADSLYKIRHWSIIQGEYRQLRNTKATWFIDSPYQEGGHKYKFGNKDIDYVKLSTWCQSRKGQIIVCENTNSNWLPFKPMRDMRGIAKRTTEAIWSNYPTAFDHEQLSMFP